MALSLLPQLLASKTLNDGFVFVAAVAGFEDTKTLNDGIVFAAAVAGFEDTE